jgi:hypothetical protein
MQAAFTGVRNSRFRSLAGNITLNKIQFVDQVCAKTPFSNLRNLTFREKMEKPFLEKQSLLLL